MLYMRLTPRWSLTGRRLVVLALPVIVLLGAAIAVAQSWHVVARGELLDYLPGYDKVDACALSAWSSTSTYRAARSIP